MAPITLNCEVVTPMFLAGADGITPELRPPSIKGAMRWWFRAMMGGILVNKYSGKELLNHLTKLESEIFGSTEKKSKFGIFVKESIKNENTRIINFKDFKVDDGRKRNCIRYMGYGLGEGAMKKSYIVPGTEIIFNISFMNTNELHKKIIIGSFWLLIYLGSLGARARRGWGNLKINSEHNLFDLKLKNPKIENYSDYLQKSISIIRDDFITYSKTNNNEINFTGRPDFSMIHPKCWELLIEKNPQIGFENALSNAGFLLRNFRESNIKHKRFSSSGKPIHYQITRDYQNVKAFFNNPKQHKTPTCSIFGLPHQYQFQSKGEKVMIIGEKEERRASPLLFKFVEQNNNYYLMLQSFKSKFISGNLKFENMNNINDYDFVMPPNYNEIDNFMNQFKNNSWEVKL